MRRRNAWLARSHTQVLHLTNQAFAYHAVDPDGGPGLAALLNVSATQTEFPLADLAGEACSQAQARKTCPHI
jgi:hypothetical protein